MWRELVRFGLALAVLVPGVGLAAGTAIPTIYLYVNDLTSPGVLLRSEVTDIEDVCYQVDVATTAEIAVLLVNTTAPEGIDWFAAETFARNGIGKAGQDNGVLIVVSTDERLWRVEVGYGLEGVLTDSFVGRVGQDNLSPAISAGDFYTGIYNGTVLIGQQILDLYVPPSGNHPPPDLIVIDWKSVAIGVGILLLIGVITKGKVFLWFGRIFMRGGFGGGRSGGGGARGGF